VADKHAHFTADVARLVGAKAEYAGVEYQAAADEVLGYMEEGSGLGLTAALDKFIRNHREEHQRKVRAVQVQYEVTSYKVPGMVLDVAMDLADGDISRLAIQADGSIVVLNQSRRPE